MGRAIRSSSLRLRWPSTASVGRSCRGGEAGRGGFSNDGRQGAGPNGDAAAVRRKGPAERIHENTFDRLDFQSGQPAGITRSREADARGDLETLGQPAGSLPEMVSVSASRAAEIRRSPRSACRPRFTAFSTSGCGRELGASRPRASTLTRDEDGALPACDRLRPGAASAGPPRCRGPRGGCFRHGAATTRARSARPRRSTNTCRRSRRPRRRTQSR